MFDPSGERPLEAASETTYVGHHPASGANTEFAPEHFPTLSLEVGRPYLHVAAGAIFKKLQRSPRACPLRKRENAMSRFFGTAAFALALGFERVIAK